MVCCISDGRLWNVPWCDHFLDRNETLQTCRCDEAHSGGGHFPTENIRTHHPSCSCRWHDWLAHSGKYFRKRLIRCISLWSTSGCLFLFFSLEKSKYFGKTTDRRHALHLCSGYYFLG